MNPHDIKALQQACRDRRHELEAAKAALTVAEAAILFYQYSDNVPLLIQDAGEDYTEKLLRTRYALAGDGRCRIFFGDYLHPNALKYRDQHQMGTLSLEKGRDGNLLVHRWVDEHRRINVASLQNRYSQFHLWVDVAQDFTGVGQRYHPWDFEDDEIEGKRLATILIGAHGDQNRPDLVTAMRKVEEVAREMGCINDGFIRPNMALVNELGREDFFAEETS